MRRILLCWMVVGLASSAADAEVTATVTDLGVAFVQQGAALVHVWNITFTSDDDLIAGVFFDWPGPTYQMGAAPVFPYMPYPFHTPTLTEAGYLPDPLIDTHFNLELADFVPTIMPPTEINDFQYGRQPNWSEGLGSLSVQADLSVSAQAPTVDLVNLALPLPTLLAPWLGRNPVGPLVAIIREKSGAEYEFYLIPEPATLSLLCLGALAVVRRRR